MIIGILSDSHGRTRITADAIRLLLEHGAELLIHLGDVETCEVIDELAGHRAHLVLGNCDFDEAGLTDHARRLDITVDHPAGLIEADGKSIAFTHGHFGRHMLEPIRNGADFLLHGHTHEVRDERVESTRVINPGALFRARRYTVATLDPGQDVVAFHELPRD